MGLIVKRRVTLDLSRRGHQVTVPFSVGDRVAHEVIFTLRDGSELIELPPGVTAAITIKNGYNGTGCVDACVIDHVNNTITYTPTVEALSIEGNIECSLEVFDADKAKIGSPTFIFAVSEGDNANTEREVSDALVASPSWGIIAETVSKAEAAATSAGNAATSEGNAAKSEGNAAKSAEAAAISAGAAATSAGEAAEKAAAQVLKKTNENAGRAEDAADRAKKSEGNCDDMVLGMQELYELAVGLSEEAKSAAESAQSAYLWAQQEADRATEYGTSLLVQETGNDDRKVMSQDASTKAFVGRSEVISYIIQEIAKIVANAPTDFDTLKEIADYIASDKTNAAEINSKLSKHEKEILDNKTAIENLPELVDGTGDREDAVMSQKAVTENLNFINEEISLEWYRKAITIYDDGGVYDDCFTDSTTRLSFLKVTRDCLDITDKTVRVSVDEGFKYACALCKHVGTVDSYSLRVNPNTPWQYYTEPTTWVADGDYRCIIIMLAKVDNSEILPAEASAISVEEINIAPNDVKERILQLEKEITNLKSVSLNGKKWLFIGDSITEHNFRASKNYDDFLAEWLGISPVNVGMSGTGVTYPFGGNPCWLDKMAEYPADVDVISVMGALNDRHTELGAWGDRGTNTVYGAVWNYFNNLINKYPNKPIIYITSTPRSYSYGVDGEFTAWVDAFIKTAHNFSIPVLDLYRNSGMRPWNATHNAEYFSCPDAPTGDGVHPNEKGQRLMALKIAEFAKQYLVQ